MLCREREKKLSDFGIEWSSNSFIFIWPIGIMYIRFGFCSY